MAEKNNQLIISSNTFKSSADDGIEVEGLTVLLEGQLKDIFDNLRRQGNAATNNEVLKDIIIAGVNALDATQIISANENS